LNFHRVDVAQKLPHAEDMPNRSSKRGQGPQDPNVLAFNIVQMATGQMPKPEEPVKNQSAVTLGRLGGLKGGRARADKLTAEQKVAIAKKAAEARWLKKTGNPDD
jgi:hypothetical protein